MVSVQDDIDKLSKWASEWKMRFNARKCKSMTIGKNTTDLFLPFSIWDSSTNIKHFLAETDSERDLGVQLKEI